jgi:aspartyl-tRNA(Asn)/glutamyl-tRNA(Gln) amidotransferase subunit A
VKIDALTVEEFGRKLRSGSISAADATEACLGRIRASDPELNAFILVTADRARQQARQADRELAAGHDRGPLHGVPISIKDLFDVRGTPTTAASRVREGHTALSDAPAVTLLRRAGAVFVGKTNLHEFALGTTNEDSAFGSARNPHDTTRSPGGSSGGSAASVAAGMALAAIGTDTGGSIRIPAAACGVVGLKPTVGELPTGGVVPLSRTLDHIGPLARTVTDAWRIYRALLGRSTWRPLANAAVSGLRLGALTGYFLELLDDDVRTSFDRALDALRAGGTVVRPAEIANAAEISSVYLHVMLSEAAAYHAATLESIPDRYTTPVRQRLEIGRYILAEDYVRALAGREVLQRRVDAALSSCDALVLPTVPIPAPPLGSDQVRVGGLLHPVRNVMLRLTQLFNLTGHPAISVPCGQTSAGLPCGLQIVGSRRRTEELISIAAAVEAVLSSV